MKIHKLWLSNYAVQMEIDHFDVISEWVEKAIAQYEFSSFLGIKLRSNFWPKNSLMILLIFHFILGKIIFTLIWIYKVSDDICNKWKWDDLKIYGRWLTSESAPLSAPGHLKVTYSWHLLWTTNEQTKEEKMLSLSWYLWLLEVITLTLETLFAKAPAKWEF